MVFSVCQFLCASPSATVTAAVAIPARASALLQHFQVQRADRRVGDVDRARLAKCGTIAGPRTARADMDRVAARS